MSHLLPGREWLRRCLTRRGSRRPSLTRDWDPTTIHRHAAEPHAAGEKRRHHARRLWRSARQNRSAKVPAPRGNRVGSAPGAVRSHATSLPRTRRGTQTIARSLHAHGDVLVLIDDHRRCRVGRAQAAHLEWAVPSPGRVLVAMAQAVLRTLDCDVVKLGASSSPQSPGRRRLLWGR